MREILFRGKSERFGNWIEGSLIVSRNLESGQLEYLIAPLSAYYTEVKKVDPETVGQYTGLTDKNGTKIFEGNILQFDYIGNNLGVNGIALVSFQNGKFGVEWGYHKEFVCLDGFANTTLEVIGNTVDNPELLDGEQWNANDI